MKNKVKYIWIVEKKIFHEDGRNGGSTLSYFSSREKAMIHIDCIKAWSENNNAQLIDWDDAKMSGSYELKYGDTLVIKTERKAIDFDDFLMGEC